MNAGSSPRPGGGSGGDGEGSGPRGLPSFVPEQYAPILARATQRWNVSATLLAAQLYADTCLLLEA